MTRLFVAVWPPDDLVGHLAALDRPEYPGVRWTTEDQWHVTLRFLGEADPDAAAAALETVRHPVVRARVGPTIERLGPGALVASVEGLDTLASAVAAATSDIGRPPERRRFRGHLTLARLKQPVAPVPLLGRPINGRWAVEEVTLVQSELLPDGSRYTVVHAVPLGAVRRRSSLRPRADGSSSTRDRPDARGVGDSLC